MSKTKIEWTEKVWNPVTGCTKVSAGCKHCYAETIAKRFWKDRKFTDVQCHTERLEQPLHWKKPSMVFVNSMSDLFHEDMPFDFISIVWKIMQESFQHTFQVLTKRPKRMLEFYESKYLPIIDGWEHDKNIWLGVSIENQKTADERIPLLLETPAKVRWVSIEPMLEEIDITPFLKKSIKVFLGYNSEGKLPTGIDKLNWVVVGCESGNQRRECKLEWIESIVEQCKEAGVPVFVKQLSIGGKVIKDINLFPEHLRIREYPKGELK